MAVGPATVYDFFTRTTTDNLGTASSGHAWEGDDFSFYDVKGTYANIYVAAGRSTSSYNVYVNGFNEEQAEVLALVQWTVDTKTDHGPTLRRANSTNYYNLRIRDGDHKITIQSTINGTRVDLADYAVSLSKNQNYWVRFRADTNLKAKIWAEGTAEPGSWQVTASFPIGGPTKGSIGYRNVSTTGGTYAVKLGAFFGYTTDEPEPPLPVTDTFSRPVAKGFGAADTKHFWEGDMSLDPASYANTSVGDVNATYGSVVLPSATTKRALIGPSSPLTEIHIVASCSLNGGVIVAGVHGVGSYSSGAISVAGYGLRLEWNNTTLRLKDRDLSTDLGTYTLGTAPVAGDTWHLKLQGNGAALSAKAWKDGTAEPGSWQITATDSTSPVTSGRGFVTTTSGASSTTFRFYDATFGYLTSDPNRLVAGSLTTTTLNDTRIDFQATYTGDANDNSTCVMQIREQGAASWSTVSNSVNRGTKTFSSIGTAFLIPGTYYDLRATFSDADGVSGTNPLQVTVQTTLSGLTTQPISIVTHATTVDIVAPYLEDSNSNSTAFALVAPSGLIDTVFCTDTYTDTNGTNLTAHTGEAGATWTKLTGYANNILIESNAAYSASAGTAVYYASATPPGGGANYDVYATVEYKTTNGGSVSLLARIDHTAGSATYYSFKFDSSNQTVQIDRYVSGVGSGGSASRINKVVTDVFEMRFSVRGSLLIGYIDGVVVCARWDTNITAAGRGGIRLEGSSGSYATAGVVVRSMGQSALFPFHTDLVAQLTADRPNKRFTGTVSGLSNDTLYQVAVIYYDNGGVTGTNPRLESFLSLGKGIGLEAINAFPSEISAAIVVEYDLDTDDDSSCSIQYRSIRDELWTTVNASAIQVSRGLKSFTTILTNLIPNLSYEAKAIVSDPDGTSAGYPTELTTSFTTKGKVFDPDVRGKHYVWKIYDHLGSFIGVWENAPEPDFDFFSNGGISDITPSLPWTLSRAASDRTLGHGNRLDLWAIDGQSEGFGPNLLLDSDMDLGSWTLATSWSVGSTAGPDGSNGLLFSSGFNTARMVQSESVNLDVIVPLYLTVLAKASGGKLRVDMAAYDNTNTFLAASSDNAETVGPQWQKLTLAWLPPANTAYIRVRAENQGAGTMAFDKVTVRAQEVMIYQGRIEEFEPSLTEKGEEVEVQILGHVSQLADIVIDHLQYVTSQPSDDAQEGRDYKPPDDPSTMMMDIIDYMNESSPNCSLFYTADSINLTNVVAEYTFQDVTCQDAFDTIVEELCPAGWTYYVAANGLVHLNGPQHVATHDLRLQVEVMEFSNNRSINDLKNYIIVKGRKDSDESEPDGDGTIRYVAFNQDSIDRYGRRDHIVNNSNVKDNDTAELVAEGTLEEKCVVQEQGRAKVPDEKDLRYAGSVLRGYNIESFRPGDFVRIFDPVVSDSFSFWDTAKWDVDRWDFNDVALIPPLVPIKTIKYRGDHVELELTERPPSVSGAYAKMRKWQRRLDAQSAKEK